jgi:hypothetical protein
MGRGRGALATLHIRLQFGARMALAPVVARGSRAQQRDQNALLLAPVAGPVDLLQAKMFEAQLAPKPSLDPIWPKAFI